MTCTTCLDNCDPLVTDKCTKYTGPNVEELGVCKNTSLYEVEAIILDALVNINSNIKYTSFTSTCSFVTSLLAGSATQPFSLQQFGDVVLSGLCQLDAKISAITPTSFSFDTSCLTGDLTSRDKILQATISKACSVDTRLIAVEEDYVKLSDFCAQVTACLPDIPSVTPTSAQWSSRMVPYAPIPYVGSLSNFDNTGKGLTSAGFEKVYLMNGLNGTQDWRGRSPIGAIQNVPGGSLDTAVDPSLSPNIAYNYSVGTKGGVSSVTLGTSQIPSHSHAVVDPGHTHKQKVTYLYSGTQYENGAIDDGSQRPLLYKLESTESALTGISVSAAGGGLAHTNVHPVIGCLFIIYIP